jgi:hypothetical protein
MCNLKTQLHKQRAQLQIADTELQLGSEEKCGARRSSDKQAGKSSIWMSQAEQISRNLGRERTLSFLKEDCMLKHGATRPNI